MNFDDLKCANPSHFFYAQGHIERNLWVMFIIFMRILSLVTGFHIYTLPCQSQAKLFLSGTASQCPAEINVIIDGIDGQWQWLAYRGMWINRFGSMRPNQITSDRSHTSHNTSQELDEATTLYRKTLNEGNL